MDSNPASVSTSDLTREAFEQRGLLDALVNALVSPLPHGPDGEQSGDADFEEKIIGYVLESLTSGGGTADALHRALNTYLVLCNGQLSSEQKKALSSYTHEQTQKAGGDEMLAERWGMTAEEVRQFKQSLA